MLFGVNLLLTCAVLLAEEFRPAFRLHCYCKHLSLPFLPQTPTLEESTGERGVQKDVSEVNFSQKLSSHRSVIFRGVSPCPKQLFRRLLETRRQRFVRNFLFFFNLGGCDFSMRVFKNSKEALRFLNEGLQKFRGGGCDFSMRVFKSSKEALRFLNEGLQKFQGGPRS